MKLVPAVLLLVVLAGCASGGGAAAVSEGLTLRLNVFAPGELAAGAEGSLDVDVSNHGPGPTDNVLVDVTFPPSLDVVHESHGIGVSLIRDPKLYRYTINGLGVGSTTRIHFSVRGSGEVNIVAQQPMIAGDRLERTVVIRAK